MEEKMKKQSGFTAIELLVVIFILGIMAAIAIPNFFSYLPKYRLNGATRTVAGDLMSARMMAVKLNKTAYLEYKNSKQYEIKSSGTVLNARDISLEYPDVVFKTDFNKIGFSSRGSSDADKSITLRSTTNNKEKVIQIGISGRVKIQ